MTRFYAHFEGDALGSLYDKPGDSEGWGSFVEWLRDNGHLLNPRVRFGAFFAQVSSAPADT